MENHKAYHGHEQTLPGKQYGIVIIILNVVLGLLIFVKSHPVIIASTPPAGSKYAFL